MGLWGIFFKLFLSEVFRFQHDMVDMRHKYNLRQKYNFFLFHHKYYVPKIYDVLNYYF
jgi:hypothetical protein